MKKFALLFIMLPISILAFSQMGHKEMHIWPGEVPGETEAKHPPVASKDPNRGFRRLTDVTDPTLTVYQPDASKRNGAAIVLCPGGGYQILAIDLEGYEIAEWLNSLGITVFILEYRVPDKKAGALQDIQRSLRLVSPTPKARRPLKAPATTTAPGMDRTCPHAAVV